MLFVGTKKQAQETIKEEAERCGMFYVNQRWLGGMLTNFKTINRSIARLQELENEGRRLVRCITQERSAETGKRAGQTQQVPRGIREMRRLPGAIFVVDPRKERIAVAEARKLGIQLWR